jgi:hypothetical protein
MVIWQIKKQDLALALSWDCVDKDFIFVGGICNLGYYFFSLWQVFASS